MTLIHILLLAYASVGCAYWAWMVVGAWLAARRVPKLADLRPPDPPRWPKLSIIIPACNEADTIEAAVATVLQQDYPELQVVLIDDRSDDGTGQLVDRIAASDARVHPVHVTELPDGWLGKVHALDQGVRHAGGDFLLMMDADVHLAPGVLRRAVAWCEQQQLDHLAAAPAIRADQWLLKVAIAVFLRTFCVGMRVWAVSNPRSSAYIGIGAFNLVRRSAFERTEGFPWLRLEVADDAGLGLLMKRSGARCAVAGANRHVRVHWYRSLAEMARGAEKGFASVAHCSIRRLLAVCVAMVALELAPLVVLLAALLPSGPAGLLPLGLVMVGLAVASVVILYWWGRDPIWPGLLFPLGILLNVVILLRVGWLGWRRGGILWRGTLYPSELLRGNLRVKWP